MSRVRRVLVVLALLTASVALSHDLTPNNHPGWLHFHVSGQVRTAGGQGIENVNVFWSSSSTSGPGGAANATPRLGVFQIVPHKGASGTCSVEAPPVRCAGDGRYDLVVYFDRPACEASLKDLVSSFAIAVSKEGYSFARVK